MEIQFIKTHEDAKLPVKNHDDPRLGDAGFDLFALYDTVIEPGESAIVEVGLKLAYITPGYFFRVEGRSGLGFKKGLQPHFGIIDNGYKGDLRIKIYNLSNETQEIRSGVGVAQIIPYIIERCQVKFSEVATQEIRSGVGVAQIIPYITERCQVKFSEVATHSERGTKGFGSSGL